MNWKRWKGIRIEHNGVTMEKSNQKILFLGYVSGASTCLSNINYSCGLVWFGSVPKMQTAN